MVYGTGIGLRNPDGSMTHIPISRLVNISDRTVRLRCPTSWIDLPRNQVHVEHYPQIDRLNSGWGESPLKRARTGENPMTELGRAITETMDEYARIGMKVVRTVDSANMIRAAVTRKLGMPTQDLSVVFTDPNSGFGVRVSAPRLGVVTWPECARVAPKSTVTEHTVNVVGYSEPPNCCRPCDSLDVEYDSVALRDLLVKDQSIREDRPTNLKREPLTQAQRAAVSAHWSAQLRAKVRASDAERAAAQTSVVLPDLDLEVANCKDAP